MHAGFHGEAVDIGGQRALASASMGCRLIAFRPWSNHYVATVFGKPGVDLSPDLPTVPIGPWSLWPEGCPNCGLNLDHPNWEIDPFDERLIIRGRNIAVDVSARVAPGIVSDLLTTDGLRLTVAEGDSWMRDGTMRLATMSFDATEVRSVVIAQGAMLTRPRPVDLLVRSSSTPPAEHDSPPPRAQFGSVLSVTENALFIVGGLNENGLATEDLWQYDPVMGAWIERRIAGVMPKAVLAATVRPE